MEIGFFTEIDMASLESCMRNNYFTAAYAAHLVLKLWMEDDRAANSSGKKRRQIVFINSAAAFLGIPGYAAYTCKLSVPRRNREAALILLEQKPQSAQSAGWQIL